MEFKGTNYAFAKNINHTGGSGIIDITDNTIFCLCTEDKAKVISELLKQRNELLEALKAIEENGTGYVISYDDLQEARELLNKIQP